jgi:hypothetical protein
MDRSPRSRSADQSNGTLTTVLGSCASLHAPGKEAIADDLATPTAAETRVRVRAHARASAVPATES